MARSLHARTHIGAKAVGRDQLRRRRADGATVGRLIGRLLAADALLTLMAVDGRQAGNETDLSGGGFKRSEATQFNEQTRAHSCRHRPISPAPPASLRRPSQRSPGGHRRLT